MRTLKMIILAAICVLLTLCLFACSGSGEKHSADETGRTYGQTTTDYNRGTSGSYGQINTTNGNADGGIGDYYEDTDMSLDGVARDMTRDTADVVEDAARDVGDALDSDTYRNTKY